MELKKIPVGTCFAPDEKLGSRFLVSGPSGCGKSTAVIYGLRRGWFGQYDERILMTPSSSQAVYRGVKWTQVVPEFRQEFLEEVMAKQAEREKRGVARRVLLLVDDILGEQGLRVSGAPLVKLYTRGRHLKIDTITIVQRLFAIPPDIRQNSSLMAFESRNANEIDAIFNTCGWGRPRDFAAAVGKIWDQPRRPLIWCQPKNLHYAGYDQEIVVTRRRAAELESDSKKPAAALSDAPSAAKTAEPKDDDEALKSQEAKPDAHSAEARPSSP